MGFERFEEHTLANESYYADNTSGTTFQGVTGSHPEPYRIDAFIFTSNSASPQDVEIGIHIGPLTYPLGQITVPALAGTPGVPAVDAVAALAPPSIGAFLIEPLRTLEARQVTALTGGDVVLGFTMGGTF
jgi:hypothetical protein